MRNRITFGKLRMIAAALLTLVALGVATTRWTPVPASADGPAPKGAEAGKSPAPDASPAIQDEPCLCNLPLLPWSSIASTWAVDEDSLFLYAFGDPWASYRPGSASTQTLTFRTNVTNIGHDTRVPGYTQLSLSSHVLDPDTSVTATLFRVHPCNGQIQEICTTKNDQVTDEPVCTTCPEPFNPAAINFSTAKYYVRVNLNRPNSMDTPPLAYSVHLIP